MTRFYCEHEKNPEGAVVSRTVRVEDPDGDSVEVVRFIYGKDSVVYFCTKCDQSDTDDVLIFGGSNTHQCEHIVAAKSHACKLMLLQEGEG